MYSCRFSKCWLQYTTRNFEYCIQHNYPGLNSGCTLLDKYNCYLIGYNWQNKQYRCPRSHIFGSEKCCRIHRALKCCWLLRELYMCKFHRQAGNHGSKCCIHPSDHIASSCSCYKIGRLLDCSSWIHQCTHDRIPQIVEIHSRIWSRHKEPDNISSWWCCSWGKQPSTPVYFAGGVAENVSASAGRAYVYEATLLAKGNIAVK